MLRIAIVCMLYSGLGGENSIADHQPEILTDLLGKLAEPGRT